MYMETNIFFLSTGIFVLKWQYFNAFVLQQLLLVTMGLLAVALIDPCFAIQFI